jgi:dTDP-D-glucose 4,6-dehydratase
MLSAKRGGKIMAMIHDFVEDWIEMRSKLQRQLKLLESGKMGEETYVIGSTAEATAIRLKKWIDELNDLLKEYAPSDRT